MKMVSSKLVNSVQLNSVTFGEVEGDKYIETLKEHAEKLEISYSGNLQGKRYFEMAFQLEQNIKCFSNEGLHAEVFVKSLQYLDLFKQILMKIHKSNTTAVVPDKTIPILYKQTLVAAGEIMTLAENAKKNIKEKIRRHYEKHYYEEKEQKTEEEIKQLPPEHEGLDDEGLDDISRRIAALKEHDTVEKKSVEQKCVEQKSVEKKSVEQKCDHMTGHSHNMMDGEGDIALRVAMLKSGTEPVGMDGEGDIGNDASDDHIMSRVAALKLDNASMDGSTADNDGDDDNMLLRLAAVKRDFSDVQCESLNSNSGPVVPIGEPTRNQGLEEPFAPPTESLSEVVDDDLSARLAALKSDFVSNSGCESFEKTKQTSDLLDTSQRQTQRQSSEKLENPEDLTELKSLFNHEEITRLISKDPLLDYDTNLDVLLHDASATNTPHIGNTSYNTEDSISSALSFSTLASTMASPSEYNGKYNFQETSLISYPSMGTSSFSSSSSTGNSFSPSTVGLIGGRYPTMETDINEGLGSGLLQGKDLSAKGACNQGASNHPTTASSSYPVSYTVSYPSFPMSSSTASAYSLASLPAPAKYPSLEDLQGQDLTGKSFFCPDVVADENNQWQSSNPHDLNFCDCYYAGDDRTVSENGEVNVIGAVAAGVVTEGAVAVPRLFKNQYPIVAGVPLMSKSTVGSSFPSLETPSFQSFGDSSRNTDKLCNSFAKHANKIVEGRMNQSGALDEEIAFIEREEDGFQIIDENSVQLVNDTQSDEISKDEECSPTAQKGKKQIRFTTDDTVYIPQANRRASLKAQLKAKMTDGGRSPKGGTPYPLVNPIKSNPNTAFYLGGPKKKGILSKGGKGMKDAKVTFPNDDAAKVTFPNDDAAKASFPNDDVAEVTYGEENLNLKLSKSMRIDLPADTINKFVKVAYENTKKNIETCGWLVGRKMLKENIMYIDYILIPPQKGDDVTCESTDEIGVLEWQLSKKNCLTFGWIHTHPKHNCFLSAIDLHHQCSFQLQEPMSIAIVYSGLESGNTNNREAGINRKAGIFRLTDYGVKHIQNCKQTGFHPHDQAKEPLYGKAEAISVNKYRKIQVIDFREGGKGKVLNI